MIGEGRIAQRVRSPPRDTPTSWAETLRPPSLVSSHPTAPLSSTLCLVLIRVRSRALSYRNLLAGVQWPWAPSALSWRGHKLGDEIFVVYFVMCGYG
jgi:hypothetical protein